MNLKFIPKPAPKQPCCAKLAWRNDFQSPLPCTVLFFVLLERPVQDRLVVPQVPSVRMSTSGTTGGAIPVFYSKDFYIYAVALYVFCVTRAHGEPCFGSSAMIAYDSRANNRQHMSDKPSSTRRSFARLGVVPGRDVRRRARHLLEVHEAMFSR